MGSGPSSCKRMQQDVKLWVVEAPEGQPQWERVSDDALGNQLLLILHSSPAVTPLDTCHDPERKQNLLSALMVH